MHLIKRKLQPVKNGLKFSRKFDSWELKYNFDEEEGDFDNETDFEKDQGKIKRD